MKAAIVTEKGKAPIYGDFEEPELKEGNVIVDVKASALSNLTKMRAMGRHYSADTIYPNVAGTDGVGVLNGKRVYFLATNAPYGSLAEKTLIDDCHYPMESMMLRQQLLPIQGCLRGQPW